MGPVSTPTRSGHRWVTGQPWLSLLIRVALAVVWLWAGGTKLTDLAGNVRSVRAYRLLPDSVAQAVGSGQPFVEIALGLLLLVGLGVRVSAVLSALLLLIFIAGIVSAAARGLRIDCGCFSSGGNLQADQNTQYLQEVLRDIAFLLLSAFLIRWPRGRASADGLLFPPIEETA